MTFRRLAATAPWNPVFGTAGAGTFVALFQAGAVVEFEWATDVQKAWTGLEYRTALLSQPRQTYKATAFLLGGDQRDVRSALVVNAAQGQPFLLALPWEEATVLVSSPASAVTVSNTALLDWAQIGQRVIVIGVDGSSLQATVQAVTSGTVLTLGDAVTGAAVTLGATGNAGARILPMVAVYLDPQQGFKRHPVTLEEWEIVARSSTFGYAGVAAYGLGATVQIYLDPTWGATPVWDRPIVASGTIGDSIQTLADLVDLGGVPANLGSAPAADFGRELSLVGDTASLDWQWIKAFLWTVRGRQERFLVPTMRPDMIAVSVSGTSLLVYNGTSYGAPLQFIFSSAAQKRLWLTKTDGSYQIVAISAAVDNGDGTVTLTLAASVTGTVAMISWLETCRFENDTLSVTFQNGSFAFDEQARVVQQ